MTEAEKISERFEQLKKKIVSEHARLLKEIEEKARSILNNIYKQLEK